MADILARLKLRAGTLAAWTSANPILAAGEPGFEVDTKILRVGDGSTPFLSLERFQTSDGFASTFQPIADNLTAFSALTFAANKLPYGVGIGAFALTDLTAEARTFLAQTTKLAQRNSLELADTATTPLAGESNMTINGDRVPTRNAVGAAILAVGGPAKRITFTASGTFIKGDHGLYPNDHIVRIQAWGGGGGGDAIRGGGGGAYVEIAVRFADIASSVNVTVGGGGAVGLAGGASSFGFLLTAPPGNGPSGGFGGFGGGYSFGAGGASDPATPGQRAPDVWGGGGGGGGSSSGGIAGAGGQGFFGGGGGGGFGVVANGAGGTSTYGGNGGAPNVAGAAPGGGGGANAIGGRGEVRVWL